MWNRVVLLTAGVALGWSLTTSLSARQEHLASARVHMGLAMLLGLGLIIWLGIENAAASLVGVFVFGVGALATYAMRAKQILRITETALPLPDTPPASQDGHLAILIAPGPPPSYSPESVARLQTVGALPPQLGRHWFMAPVAYGKVRQAYKRHGPLPLWNTLETARKQLQERLGRGWHVELLYLYDASSAESQIRVRREQGHGDVVLLPVDLDDDARAEIATLASNLSAEGPGTVRVAPTTQLVPDAIYQASLNALIADTSPPAACPTPDKAIVEALAEHARVLGSASSSSQDNRMRH